MRFCCGFQREDPVIFGFLASLEPNLSLGQSLLVNPYLLFFLLPSVR